MARAWNPFPPTKRSIMGLGWLERCRNAIEGSIYLQNWSLVNNKQSRDTIIVSQLVGQATPLPTSWVFDTTLATHPLLDAHVAAWGRRLGSLKVRADESLGLTRGRPMTSYDPAPSVPLPWPRDTHPLARALLARYRLAPVRSSRGWVMSPRRLARASRPGRTMPRRIPRPSSVSVRTYLQSRPVSGQYSKRPPRTASDDWAGRGSASTVGRYPPPCCSILNSPGEATYERYQLPANTCDLVSEVANSSVGARKPSIRL